MSPQNENEDQGIISKSNGTDLGKYAAYVGAVSALVLFIGTTSAWMESRGSLAALGLPGDLISIRASLDRLPSLGFRYIWLFAICFPITAFLLPFLEKALDEKPEEGTPFGFYVIIPLAFACTIVEVWLRPRTPDALIIPGEMLLPFLLGSIYQCILRQRKLKHFVAVLVVIATVLLYCESLFISGVKSAFEMAENAERPRHRGEFMSADLDIVGIGQDQGLYPLVALRAKEKLHLLTVPATEGNEYIYESKRPSFIRFITMDDANYYLVENSKGSVRSLAVRKELVLDMLFENAPVTLGFHR
jgi:hypothetical protein